MSTIVDSIPTKVLRPIIDGWIATFDIPEYAYQFLAANSRAPADTWRIRLSDLRYQSRRTGIWYPRGWWSFESLDASKVDSFLAAADLVHLWREQPLLQYATPSLGEGMQTDEEYDATCASCGAIINWSKGRMAGLRVELKRPPNRYEWWSWCLNCAADALPIPPAKRRGRISDRQIRLLYKKYVLSQMGIRGGGVASQVWRKHGFASEASCAMTLSEAWRKMGLPLRSRGEARRLNSQARGPTLPAKLTTERVRHAYVLHQQADLSLNELGRRLHEQFGYTTAHACSVAISQGFKAMGLRARDRIEMTVLASTKNGLSPRDDEKRRAARKAAGLTVHGHVRQKLCGDYGHTTRKGTPCSRPVMMGKESCKQHDPTWLLANQAHLARGRSRRLAKTVPADSLREALIAWKTYTGGTWRALSAKAGVPEAYIGSVAAGRIKRCNPERAALIASSLERITSIAA